MKGVIQPAHAVLFLLSMRPVNAHHRLARNFVSRTHNLLVFIHGRLSIYLQQMTISNFAAFSKITNKA